ncbi:hypothetical protein F2K62_004123, partial [Vibrio fluvialis]|nr:hypothetical protein [Vibrio fluvialis]
MQISTYDAVKLGFVLGENGERLNENDYKDSSSFDLEVKAILTLDTDTNEVINSGRIQNLKPQACAYLVSKQYICVPKGYIAYVFLKNRMGQRGLLALNTGIIDQNYYGPISTLVINLSKNHAAIPDLAAPTDLTFFRVVFHKVDFSDAEENEELVFPNFKYEYETYLGNCKKRLLDYPENFLNTGVIEKRLEAAITQKAGDFSLRKLMIYLSLLAVVFTLLPFLRDNFFAWKYDLKSS